ncbi:MAG TPA: 3-dehydroquinate synthase [Pseudomonadota bacterium]|nr:3-dehydroquinate synthase [Pseudomonadota bacterium]
MSPSPIGTASLQIAYPGGSYPVWLGSGLLDQVGAVVATLRAGGHKLGSRVLVVSDDHVEPLYAPRLTASLSAAGLSVSTFVMPAGEGNKRLTSVGHIYDACVRTRLDRESLLVALGGGVVGDVVGFAAATYLRGLPLLQVPTTLLSMTDSSIGGKVGVDLPQGKNLVGAFKQPVGVVIDVGCLATLPVAELRAGVAEIVKAALLTGGESLTTLHALADAVAARGWASDAVQSLLQEALSQALECKRRIVAADPFEDGERALLNLGHTFGHALEAWTQYSLRHGEAVALGLLCAARLSAARGLCSPSLVAQVVSLLQRLGLPTRLPSIATLAAAQEVMASMQHDKKRSADRLRFILLPQPGQATIVSDVSESEVLNVLVQLSTPVSR